MINKINENSNWVAIEDPCNSELGFGWRIPTLTEWNNAIISGSWSNYNNTFASNIKLHAAGFVYNNGNLNLRGSYGIYWTSNQENDTNARYLWIYNGGSLVWSPAGKAYAGSSIRCIRDTNNQLSSPTVTTKTPSSITTNTAVSGGNVTSNGGSIVTSRGICYSKFPNPTTTDSIVECFSGTGLFNANLTGLTPYTRYYIRAFAINNIGVSYGNEVSFISATIPTITTNNVSNITVATANSGGNVTFNGGDTVTQKGICYGMSPNPNILLNDVINSGSGIGLFTINLTNLTASTTYYLRTFATNSMGTSYGNEVSFTTLAAQPCVNFTVNHIAGDVAPVTKTVTYGTVTTTLFGVIKCAITQNLGADHQAASATDPNEASAGWYWQFNRKQGFKFDGTNRIPSTTWITSINENSNWTAENDPCNILLGSEWRIPTGTGTNGEWYNAKINGNLSNYNTAYNSVLKIHNGGYLGSSNGNKNIYNASFWSCSQSDNSNSFSFDFTSSSSPIYNSYKSYGNSIRCVRDVSIQQSLPSLSTIPISAISQFSATSGGNITADGGIPVLVRGICYSTSPNPTITDSIIVFGSGTGEFNINITGLTHATTYYIRAYATNSLGIAYGNVLSFTTLALLPTISTSEIINITTTSATSGGSISSDGGATVTARGICYSTTPNPTILNNTVESGSGIGYFSANITGLTLSAKYYIRAYATNSTGTAYGNELSFIAALIPTVSTTAISNITVATAISGGNVTSDGGDSVTARGICYSITANPTIANSIINVGNGTGAYSATIFELASSTTYYVRAFATNSLGTAYGNQLSFTTLAPQPCISFTLNHIAGDVAPVTKTVTYYTTTTTLFGGTKCAITQNLGADRQATTPNDTTDASAGWYWQFNRKQGYKHDRTTLTPNNTWITSINENSNWTVENDPCRILLGNEWRIPTGNTTSGEWFNVKTNGNLSNYNTAYNSALKLHAAGELINNNSNVNLSYRGTWGDFWSSNQNGNGYGYELYITSGGCALSSWNKSYAFSIRCIRDASTQQTLPTITTSETSNITALTATSSGNITSDGGATITARGFCYSTSPNPTILNSTVLSGNGTGEFSANLTGLAQSTIYYLRAYATNSIGTVYGNQVSFTTPQHCFDLTTTHIAGDVAPVTKTVTYSTVSSTIFGERKCVITQNLGADHQATVATDTTEASAGWYWQFNRKQGFKHDGTYITPNTNWISSIDEYSHWIQSNDPCNILLGNTWRIPIRIEYEIVYANLSNPFNSDLKLHNSGYIIPFGSLIDRGQFGSFWTGSMSGESVANSLSINPNGYIDLSSSFKYIGKSIRCIKD